jgi:hypothetical protein
MLRTLKRELQQSPRTRIPQNVFTGVVPIHHAPSRGTHIRSRGHAPQ